MWIVRLALARPYTFVVMALVIILLTPVVLMRMPVDIFPDINIPVISLVWTYNGLEPQEMEQRITSNVDRGSYSDRPDQRHDERAAALRLRQQFYPHAARDRAGRCHALPLRRQAARRQR